MGPVIVREPLRRVGVLVVSATLSAGLPGCGGDVAVADDAGADVADTTVGDTTLDTASDTASDTVADTDGAADVPADVPRDTADGGDTALPPCKPFWCGCGACVAADIVCTRSSAGCPLGCPSGPCPEASKDGVCTGEGDRCVRNGIAGEPACLSDADCPPGKCCSGTFTPPKVGRCGGC